MRTAAPVPTQRNPVTGARSRIETIPAPVRGLVENENLVASDPRGAGVMTNWYPTQTGVRVRKGALRHGTVDAAVTSMLTYRDASAEKMFAATSADIFDMSSPVDPDVAPIPLFEGIASGYWCGAQIATTGGDFLVAVNGVRPGVIYDGTGLYPWADVAISALPFDTLTGDFTAGQIVTGGTSGATATIYGVARTSATEGSLYIGPVTGGPFSGTEALTDPLGGAAAKDGTVASVQSVTVAGVSTSDLDFVWVHKGRLWFVEKDTFSAWYLPASSIGGTATEFAMNGLFPRGGKLLFGATISSDTGDGMDDRMAFVTSEGEVAIYAGTDPASASTWALEGVYFLGGKPMGRKGQMRAGGDVVVATEIGAVSIIQAMTIDPLALSKAAVSAAIEPSWRRNAIERSVLPWEMAQSLQDGWAIVNAPLAEATEFRNFAVNLTTGAWALWTGWDCRAFAEFGGRVYAGTSGGAILQLEAGGSDDGALYEARLAGAPHHLGRLSNYKHVHMMRGTFSAATDFNSKISLSRDYEVAFPDAPGVAASTATNVWGTAVFGVDVWGGGAPRTVTTQWRSVSRNGRVIRPQVQITLGGDVEHDVELHSIDVLYDIGGSVV